LCVVAGKLSTFSHALTVSHKQLFASNPSNIS
jgi:hypothetical protein